MSSIDILVALFRLGFKKLYLLPTRLAIEPLLIEKVREEILSQFLQQLHHLLSTILSSRLFISGVHKSGLLLRANFLSSKDLESS